MLLTASYENFVRSVFVPELRCVAFSRFLRESVVSAPLTPSGDGENKTYKLNGDLLVVQQVSSLEDDTEGALADFLADAVVHADDVGGRV